MSRHAHCQLTNSFGFRTNSVRTQKSALKPEDDTAAEYKSTSELLAARIAITSPDHGLTLASCMSSCRRPTLLTNSLLIRATPVPVGDEGESPMILTTRVGCASG